MALDIFIANSHGNVEKSIPLFYNDYDKMMSFIETDSFFSLLQSIFADYYGESEVYLDELDLLKTESLAMQEQFQSLFSEGVANFIGSFFDIIDYAVRNRKTIKLVGD